MRIEKTTIPPGPLGEAIAFFIKESEKACGEKWPLTIRTMAAACFMSGAQWGAAHPDPKGVLEQCKLGSELFNKIPEM